MLGSLVLDGHESMSSQDKYGSCRFIRRFSMATWSDSPRLSGPPDTQDLGQLLLYVKDLANTVAKMAKDLEFIINGNLDANNIRANSIQAKNLQAGSVTADKIQAGAISADKIQAGAITSEKIQANAVTADKIQVRQLSAISADMGKITAGNLWRLYRYFRRPIPNGHLNT